jgi:hypothetical protein
MLLDERRLKITITLFLLTLLISSAASAFDTVRVAASETVRVYVDPPQIIDGTLAPGTLFSVSVKIANVPADPGLVGAQFNLTYNPTLLNGQVLEEVMFHNVTPPSEWDNIWQLQNTINNTAGFVAYAYTWQDAARAQEGGYYPISGNHTIANIVFKVTGTGECALSFDLVNLGDSSDPTQPIPHDSVDGYFNNIPPPMPELTVHVDPPITENSSLKIGSVFNVSVKMDSNMPHRGVVGLQFNLTWDPAILEAVGITEIMFHEVTPQNESDNIWQIMQKINNTGGYLVYAYAFMDVKAAISGGYAPINGNHTLASIALRVKDAGTSGLNLTGCKVGDPSGNPLTCETVDGVFKGSNLIPGDLNSDGIVDIMDAILASHSYGSSPGDPDWNSLADLDGNGIIDIFDMIRLAAMFGHTR